MTIYTLFTLSCIWPLEAHLQINSHMSDLSFYPHFSPRWFGIKSQKLYHFICKYFYVALKDGNSFLKHIMPVSHLNNTNNNSFISSDAQPLSTSPWLFYSDVAYGCWNLEPKEALALWLVSVIPKWFGVLSVPTSLLFFLATSWGTDWVVHPVVSHWSLPLEPQWGPVCLPCIGSWIAKLGQSLVQVFDSCSLGGGLPSIRWHRMLVVFFCGISSDLWSVPNFINSLRASERWYLNSVFLHSLICSGLLLYRKTYQLFVTLRYSS